MGTKYELEVVRSSAAGRWVQILSQLGGIPEDIMDGSKKEHPCPKCGGNTRFRMVDVQAGALLCSHCFSTKNGDGFAALAWATGCSFPEAIEKVATFCGVQPKQDSKKIDPGKDLEFMPWSSQLVQLLVNKKKGITEESMIAAGAKYARYMRKYSVYAFPIIGQTLDTANPVGWALIDFQGNDLPVFDKDGNVVRTTKIKITSGSKPGLFGVHGIERIKTAGLVQRIWKVEGLTDLLALWSNQPEAVRDKEIVLSTSCGANETPRWQASILSGYNCEVVHDADEPGQTGAKTWVQAVALQQVSGLYTRNVELPYTVEPTKGKDLRDFFNEANKYSDLDALAEKAVKVSIAKTEDGTVADPTKIEFPMYEKIMKLLQIEVMEEEENGSIHVFSTFLRKSSLIRLASRVKIEELIQYCGTPAMLHISEKADTENNVYTLQEVRKAISWTASTRRGNEDRCGVGIWQGVNDFGNETKTLVLVNNTEAARWNGDKVLRKVIAPRVDGLVLDFGAGSQDWFDFEDLTRNLKNAADPAWRIEVIEQCEALFSRWSWRNQTSDPTLITGLVLASPIQTIWEWRPLVSITGPSHSGKSFLYEAIGGGEHRVGLLGKLAFRCSQSTEAAVRQTISNTGLIPIFDEFEKSKERDSILKKILRPSTRGDTVSRGTSSQKKIDFRIRHLAWIAAIESGLREQADVNRFIQFELMLPPAGSAGKLTLPEGRELYDLGQKMLAISVYCGIEAKSLAVRLKATKADNIDPRTIEGFAVPAAILSVAYGFDDESAKNLLINLVSSVDVHEQGTPDHEDLLECILTSQINCGNPDGMLSVAQIIQPPRLASSRYSSHKAKLEAVGIKITAKDDLFLFHRQVSRTILRQTPWEGKRIDQLLKRLPGAKSEVQRIAGRSVRGITIPGDLMVLESEQDEFEFE